MVKITSIYGQLTCVLPVLPASSVLAINSEDNLRTVGVTIISIILMRKPRAGLRLARIPQL